MARQHEGIGDLKQLLKHMEPILHEGDFVFATVASTDNIPRAITLLEFKEQEGTTLVMLRHKAEELGLAYTFVSAWISISVHSALNAVGFTAAFSTALAKKGISCNVVAGYYHDHIFVAKNDKNSAIKVLRELSGD